jgi:hypothetical protein
LETAISVPAVLKQQLGVSWVMGWWGWREITAIFIFSYHRSP